MDPDKHGIIKKDLKSIVCIIFFMKNLLFFPIMAILVGFLIIAGCASTAPISAPPTTYPTMSPTTPPTISTTIATTLPTQVEPVLVNETVVFSKKDTISPGEYKTYNFEDFVVTGMDLTYQNPGEEYRIEFKSDDPMLVYVITFDQKQWISDSTRGPKYDTLQKKVLYVGLAPVAKTENLVFDESIKFTIPKMGKYLIVVDSRLSEVDLLIGRQSFKYEIKVTKLN